MFDAGWRGAINDKDAGIYALWQSVKMFPDELLERIRRVTPDRETVLAYQQYFAARPAVPRQRAELVEMAARKLAVQKMCWGGCALSAPRTDIVRYWNIARISQRVTELHRLLQSVPVRISCGDFQPLLDDPLPAILFLDPPYVVAGQRLYPHGFSDFDHARLSHALRKTVHPFVLTYDDDPVVRRLYQWAHIATRDVPYSMCKRSRRRELVITPPESEAWARAA